MKKHTQEILFGLILEFYSKDKKEEEAGSIYLSGVNQLRLFRQEPYNPKQQTLQYMTEVYPIDDPNNPNHCHSSHVNVRNIFDVFVAAGCRVSFISEDEIKMKNEQKNPKIIAKYCQVQEENRCNFIIEHGIGEIIKDCFTIYHEDIGTEINQTLVFRDQKFWYRLDTIRRYTQFNQ